MNKVKEKNAITLSRSIAPEDICVGTFVMTMHELRQVAMLKCESVEPEVTVLQFAMRPYETELPRKVLSVCLPFVVLERVNKKTEVVDTREVRLSRVSKRFAKVARKPHEPKKGVKSKKSKKKRKKKKK